MEHNNPSINTLMAFFGRPIVGIAGSVASIVGILLSVYFYIDSREAPELTYLVHPAKAAVVRTGQTSRLSILFDGQSLTSDVTAAQVSFWNAGKGPIRGASVLSPLVIRTQDGTRILEARLQKASRRVVGLSLDQTRLSAGEVAIRWNILEQGDGGVLQIVFAGDEKVQIGANAVVEGQPEVARLEYPGRPVDSDKEYFGRNRAELTFAVGTIVGGLFMTGLALVTGLRTRGESPWRGFDLFVVAQGPLLIILGIVLYFARAPAPPFGF